MKVTDLIADLAVHDVRLSSDGNSLRVDAPEGAITDEIRQTIADNKSELVSALCLRSVFSIDEFGKMVGCPERAWQLTSQAKAIFGAEVVEVVDDEGDGDA